MPRSDRLCAVLFAAGALALYVLCLAPDVFWGDAAQLQCLAADPPFGAGPRSYPLYLAGSHLVWRLTPFSPAVATNLFSALCGGVGVGLAWLVARRESESRIGGAVGALTLAVSHLYWSSSSAAEVYSLSAVFLLSLLLLVRPAAEEKRRAVFAAGFLVGLSLLHHRTLPVTAAFAAIPILVAWFRAGCAGRCVARAAAGLLVGAAPFAVLLLTGPGDPVSTLLGGAELRIPASVAGMLAYEGVFLSWNFAGPQLGLAVVGTVVAIRRPSCGRFALFAMLLTGTGLSLLSPHVGDRYIFLLPAIAAGAIVAGIGAAGLANRWRRPAFVTALLVAITVVPVSTYAFASAHLQPGQFGRFRGADRRHIEVSLWPGRAGRTEPREYAELVLDRLPPDSLLLCHWGEGQVIRYLRIIEGLRPDLEQVNMRRAVKGRTVEDALAAGRPTFLTTYPFLPIPPGSIGRYSAREVIPGTLWELVQP